MTNRRTFLSGIAAAAAVGLPAISMAAPAEGINILGPKPGDSPQIGTLVSMLTWMRPAVTRPVKGLTQANLDHLFDANANSIGALLLHLLSCTQKILFGWRWIVTRSGLARPGIEVSCDSGYHLENVKAAALKLDQKTMKEFGQDLS